MKKKTWVATLSVDRTAHESRLPEAAIGMEDGADSSRTAERASGNPAGTPEYDLRSDSGEKCFAEIRGSDKPDEWILVGAYLDSWDFGTGPQDNGTGSVSVLELARVISEIGKQPKRSIRFALWGGEEQGDLGSYAYSQAHLNELQNIAWRF